MYHSFLINSFTDGHLGCLQHLPIVNCAAMNIGVHRFFWISVSWSLAYNPGTGIASSKGNCTCSFLRKFHTVFHSGCTSLQSHQHCTRVPFSPQPFQHLLFVNLFMMAMINGVKWYLTVLLIDVCLRVSNTKHHFICLWTLCMSSLVKCLFSDIPCSNIFTDMSPKAKDIKERINKWALIKIKSFWMAKENSINMKRE